MRAGLGLNMVTRQLGWRLSWRQIRSTILQDPDCMSSPPLYPSSVHLERSLLSSTSPSSRMTMKPWWSAICCHSSGNAMRDSKSTSSTQRHGLWMVFCSRRWSTRCIHCGNWRIQDWICTCWEITVVFICNCNWWWRCSSRGPTWFSSLPTQQPSCRLSIRTPLEH